jgi:8-hydroxy-5-deazaflavin:NADPH oxidoreductase
MKVSIIGSGRMGSGLVKTLDPYVNELFWASRDKERIESFIQANKSSSISAVSYAEALEADIIIPALWFRDVIPWAKENEEKLANKIFIDITNPFTEDFTDFTLDWGNSAAEELQMLLPGTKIVGAFKNTFFQVFEEPIHEGLKSDVYVTSDHESAKQNVMTLLSPLPFRVIDGGKLKNNRIIERLTLFEREIAIRYENYPYVSNRLFGMKLSESR